MTTAPSTASTWRYAAARSSACSARTAPARPRCSRCWRRCCGSTAATPRSSASTSGRHPHEVRQLLGVTGQYAAVDENLTATENLMLFGRLLGLSKAEARERAATLLAQFALEDASDRQIAKFSGGMRRRLDLAVSLIRRPPLIFLDEPTTGLDPRTRGQMWTTIRELVADGCTILLTTQYLDEADQLADRIAVIDRGVKVAEGTPAQLKASVGSSTLQLRLTDPSYLSQAAAVIHGVLPDEPVLTPEAGGLNVPLVDADQAAEALIALRQHGISVESVSVAQPTLDEVFLALTGHDTGESDASPTHPPTTRRNWRPCDDHDDPDRPGRHRAAPGQPRRRVQPDDDDGLAGDDEDAAQPGAVLRRDRAAAAVHGDVRLHLRRRHLRRRGELPAAADPRDPGADHADGVHRDRHPAARGHGQGRLRTVQGAADRADRAAGGADGGRPAALHDRDRADVRDRDRDGLPPRWRRRWA